MNSQSLPARFINLVGLRAKLNTTPKRLFFLALLLTVLVNAQAYAQLTPSWEMPLYFEDAMGNWDTVYIGAGPEATIYPDTAYGETYDNSPFDTVLDIRLTSSFITGPYPIDSTELFYFKRMITDEDGTQFGSTAYIISNTTVVMKAAYPPVTIHYDSTQVGYPSLVNMLWASTSMPLIAHTLSEAYTYTEGTHVHPSLHCFMNASSIVENFSYYRHVDSIKGNEEDPSMSAYVQLVDGTVENVPVSVIHVFPSFDDNYFCDNYFTSVSDLGYRRDVRFVINSLVHDDCLRLDGSSVQGRAMVRTFDDSGRLVQQGVYDHLPSCMTIDGLRPGTYLVEIIIPSEGVRSMEKVVVVR